MMKSSLAAILTLISVYAYALPSAAAPLVEVTVPSAVEVSPRHQLSMYDVVETRNMTDETAEQLQDIKLPEARSGIIEKSEIVKLLRDIKAHFILPSEMKIIRSHGNVSRMEVERKIKNKIYSQCENCDVVIQISSVPANMTADWALDLNINLTKNNIMVPLSSTEGSDLKGWVVADVRRYQDVPVLNRNVKIGDVLTKDMFSTEKRQILNATDTVKSVGAVSGMQAARYLTAGQVLQFSDLKREQVLRRGQIVKAIVGGDEFEVSVNAEAQETGSIGDVVKVKNLDSQKVFAAKIVDRGVVRIE
jgi:flagella basal body P-ring formation protein FlgA